MKTEECTMRTWAEVDLDALVFNFQQLKALMKPTTKMLGVVKANAYGHGAVACAGALLEAGAEYLAVAEINEAIELRHAGITAPVLIFGYIAPGQAALIAEYDLTATVYTKEFAVALSEAAVALGKTVNIHIKLNTGMERIGFAPEQTEDILSISHLPGLVAEGIFTHLACADEEDSSSVHTQFNRFMGVVEKLNGAGLHIPLRHVLNSAGIFDFPEYQLDMVRPGIALYGYYPSHFIHTERAELRPVLSLKSRVAFIHNVMAQQGISYGWTFKAPQMMQVVTVPVGYADGYNRLLSNQGEMIIGGKKVPIIGRICMDQCMIDVTSVHTITVGDEITLIGKEGEAAVTADDIAQKTGTISYEILCAINRRVPRLYIKNGEVSGVLNGFN